MLIGADIDQLYATIAALKQGNTLINEAFQRAAQAMQAMQSGPWAGQHRQQAEAVWERIQAQFTPTLSALERITTRTEHFANNLAEAGRSFYNPAQLVYPTGVHQHDSQPTGTHQQYSQPMGAHQQYMQPPGAAAQEAISDELWHIKGTGELFDGFLTAVEGLVILGKSLVIWQGLSVRAGTSYPKQLKIFGTKETLELAFLNPHLRHMQDNFGNIAKHFIAKPTWKAVKEGFKNAPFLFAIGVATNAYDNWNEYKNDPQAVQKTVVGTTIDATVDAALTTSGIIVGTVVGGAIGGLFGPVGTAIGARVGGWLGGWAADEFSDEFSKWMQKQNWNWYKDLQDWYKDFKQHSVQQGADLIDKAVESTSQIAAQASQTAQQALDTASKAAQQLIEQGQQAQQAVSNWVGDKLKSWLNWK